MLADLAAGKVDAVVVWDLEARRALQGAVDAWLRCWMASWRARRRAHQFRPGAPQRPLSVTLVRSPWPEASGLTCVGVDVALASVVVSGIVGLGGLVASIYNVRRTTRTAYEVALDL